MSGPRSGLRSEAWRPTRGPAPLCPRSRRPSSLRRTRNRRQVNLLKLSGAGNVTLDSLALDNLVAGDEESMRGVKVSVQHFLHSLSRQCGIRTMAQPLVEDVTGEPEALLPWPPSCVRAACRPLAAGKPSLSLFSPAPCHHARRVGGAARPGQRRSSALPRPRPTRTLTRACLPRWRMQCGA
jgi:hypothetical protein